MSIHYSIVSVTDDGDLLARRIAQGLEHSEVVACRQDLAGEIARLWPRRKGFVFCMAAGIVVRVIAPLLDDKATDPAVVFCDTGGRFAVSLLSGHLGGANDLAQEVAAVIGAVPVVSTASDVKGQTPLDLWLRDHRLRPDSRAGLTRATARLVNTGRLLLYSDFPVDGLPPELELAGTPEDADLHITCQADPPGPGLALRPPVLVAGLGCNRGAPVEALKEALDQALAAGGLSGGALKALATINVKADEVGLLQLAADLDIPLYFFHRDQLNAVPGIETSDAAMAAVGAQGVAEPAAILGAGGGELLARKRKCKDVTVALARLDWRLSAPAPDRSNT